MIVLITVITGPEAPLHFIAAGTEEAIELLERVGTAEERAGELLLTPEPAELDEWYGRS